METWTGKALLTWYQGGRKVGQRSLTLEVTHPPREPQEARMGATLRLVCARAASQYGVPPRRIQVWVDGENSPFPVAATCRPGVGYCYSTGIAEVHPPPTGAELKVSEEVEGCEPGEFR